MLVRVRGEHIFGVGQDKAMVPPLAHLVVCTSYLSVQPAGAGVLRGHRG